MDEEALKGMQVAAQTRTIYDLVQLLIEVGMAEDEVLSTIAIIAEQTIRDVALKKAH